MNKKKLTIPFTQGSKTTMLDTRGDSSSATDAYTGHTLALSSWWDSPYLMTLAQGTR